MKNNIYSLDPDLLPQISRVLKAVGHPIRLQLVEALQADPHSVRELTDRLQLPQAVVSQQLKILRAGGVVHNRRQGSQMIYSLAFPGIRKLLGCLSGCQEHCRQSGPGNRPEHTGG